MTETKENLKEQEKGFFDPMVKILEKAKEAIC